MDNHFCSFFFVNRHHRYHCTYSMLQVLQVNLPDGRSRSYGLEPECHVLQLLEGHRTLHPPYLGTDSVEGALHFLQLSEELLVLVDFMAEAARDLSRTLSRVSRSHYG